MTVTAARLVGLLRSDHDDRLVVEGRDPVHDALRARRGLAAHDADRLQLVDALREREQDRHRAEGLAAEVQIEAGADDAPTNESPSCERTTSTPKRSSMIGLKTWTFRRAITARFTRRMSSSLFPLNIEPTTTSNPGWEVPIGGS